MKILLINFQRTGDIIQTFHIIYSFKRLYPDSKIYYLTNSIHSNSLKLIEGLLDHTIIVDYVKMFQFFSKNNFSNAFKYLKDLINNLNEKQFDKVINLNFSLLSGIVSSLISGQVIGAELFSSMQLKIENYFFRELFENLENYNFKLNIIEVFLRGLNLPYFTPYTNVNEPKNNFIKIIIHLGASRSEKKWGSINFIKLIKLLNTHYKGNVTFFLTGTSKEKEENYKVYKEIKNSNINIENLTEKLDLIGLKKLIENSDILISGDTSIQHIAAFTKIKSVTIFLGNAYHYHTYPYSLNKIVIFPEIECYPCKSNYKCNHQECKNKITPEKVLNALVKSKLEIKNVLRTALDKEGYIKLALF